MHVGGTNVSWALKIPPEEKRVVVSLDMTEMNKVLWKDEENLTVHVEAGIIGQDLERLVSQSDEVENGGMVPFLKFNLGK